MELLPQFWKASLEESIDRMVIFKDGADTRLSLSVKILAVNAPAVGLDMATKAIARYELINRNNGDIVYTQDVTSTGIVPISYAFVGYVRARESVNRAIQNNITQFLQSLETIDIARPMFPAGGGK